MSRPFALLALAFFAGCVCGDGLGPRPACVALLGAGLLLACAWLWPAARLTRAGLLGAAFALGAAASAAAAAEHDAASLRRLLGAEHEHAPPAYVEGVVLRDGRVDDERLRLLVEVERVGGQPAQGRARLDVGGAGPFPRPRAGDRVALWAALHAPRGFLDPGVFDARAYARRNGIQAHGYCKSTRLLRVSAPERPSLRSLAAAARAALRERLERHVLPGAERALVLALLLGDRNDLDDEIDERFRAAGTYHVLALSGAQVALVAGLLWLLARRVGLSAGASALALGTGVWSYAAFVGGDVPVVRAALMASVLACGHALELHGDLVNLLGLAALALLGVHPGAAFEVGFQLSFAATWAVIALTPVCLPRWPAWPLRVDLALRSSLSAQLGLLPLLACHFHRLAPAALLLNLAAVPLSSAVLVAGALVPLGALFGARAADVAGELAWITAHALARSADLLAALPALDVRVPTPALLTLLLYAGGLCGLLRGARRSLSLGLLGAGLLGLLLGPTPRPADGRLHLTVLDVGQGDALVLTSPRGRTLLVDAGGFPGRRFDVGEAVVAPFLWARGVRRVDALALSHAHPDHVGGAPFLLGALRVGEVWEGPAARADAGWQALDAALRGAAVTRRSLRAGDRLHWEGASVEVLAPPAPARPAWRVRNDDSLVLAVRFGDLTLLLTGDVEAQGESRLRRSAQVLKVPHHGSRSSSTPAFLAALAPRVALVSAGRGNVYGHPHPEVLARYHALGVHLLRTDRDGALTASTDGRRLWLASALDTTPRRVR